MHHALLVRGGQRGGHRCESGHHLPRPQPAAVGEQLGEAAALQQVQDECHPRGRAPPRLVHHLPQPDQVRVVQGAEQRGLPRLPLGVTGHEHLHRHRGTAVPRYGPPHLARPAATEQRLQPVPRHGRRSGRTGRSRQLVRHGPGP